MTESKIQRITLSDLRRVQTYHNLRFGPGGNDSSIVGAIIHNHKQAICGTKLSIDIFKRWNEMDTFIVGRHQNGNARPRGIHAAPAWLW